MQTQQQKQLQNLIDSSLSDEKQNMQSHAEMIVKVLSCRVDMPKHFITLLSKNLSTKDETRIEKLFDQLWFVTHKYQNKIALFNQISANKQFLLKISSLLAMKNISQTIKTKIIDLVYEWKEQFKPNKQLFPNFWNFFSNFQKKGYFPSNSNFQTKYQQAQLIQNPSSETETLKNESAKDIFDLMQQQSENLDFSKIEKAALNLFYSAVNRIVMQNAIISNTSPQILDFPPVLKQKMAELKILQDKINRFVGQNKSQTTIDIALKLIKAVHMTQKRYTELITRYLPSKFVLPQNLLKFQQYCQTNVQFLKQTNEVQKKQIYLLDLDNSGTKNNKKDDLLNFDISFHIKGHGQVEPAKSHISSFFGNLINNVNTPNQVTLSNQPNQNEFKTDYDFKGYQDPKSISQYLFN